MRGDRGSRDPVKPEAVLNDRKCPVTRGLEIIIWISPSQNGLIYY